MTRRKRLTRIFAGEMPDRPAVRLWGLEPGQEFLHPAYEPVYRLAMERTDLLTGAGSEFDLWWGRARDEIVETEEIPTDSEEWVEVVTRVRVPAGTLRSVFTRSTVGNPGYEKEHLFKDPADIEKALAVPYRPFPFSADGFHSARSKVGDAGVPVFGLDHAMYGLQRMIGSENFALWSVDHRGLLLEAIGALAQRIREHVRQAFLAQIQPVFGWVGPELCIPPLMAPKDFEDLVFRFDKPLLDLVHEGGGYVWLHCHGKMGPVLERFVEMGIDVLNPVEPPPMGDITLPEAFARVGDRMGLEGNLQTHDLMTAGRERVCELVHEAIDAGAGRRFILCPTSAYMEDPQPEPRLIENLQTYITEGVRHADAVRVTGGGAGPP